MCSRIKDRTRKITNNSDDYDEKYMKIIFNLGDDLPLNKTLEPDKMILSTSFVG